MTTPDPDTTHDVSERLAEIRERAEAATEGPWTCSGWFPHIVDNGRTDEDYVQVAEARDNGEEDARFIAHARSDVPYLLSLMEEIIREYGGHKHDCLMDSQIDESGCTCGFAQVRDAALKAEQEEQNA